MEAGHWERVYSGDAQSVYALLIVPLVFLVYRALRGRPAPTLHAPGAKFVDAYCIVFAIETLLDPLATGPLVRVLGVADGRLGTAVMLLFVLLGDFRVYLLTFALIAIAGGRGWSAALPAALGATLAVPVAAYAGTRALEAVLGTLGPNGIWPVYEALFAVVAAGMRTRLIPARLRHHPALNRYLRALLGYVVAYYALWLSADLLIQVAGLDLGWLLRMVPNQLYYAFWVPVVFFAFFRRR